MNTREFKDKIKKLIALDDIDNSLETLKDYLSSKDESLYNKVILISGQYAHLKTNLNLGLIDRMEGTTLSRIRFSIIDILDDIPNDISQGGLQNIMYLTNRPYVDMENVIGRESDIEMLATTINESNTTVLLNGWGGIGKTTVAKGYLNKYENNYKYIIWVEVTNELIIDFRNQLD